VYANSSTVVLANSTVTGNKGHNVGGCAIRAAHAAGIVLHGCRFSQNQCKGDGGALLGGNYAASTCVSGGASLMVTGSLQAFQVGNATQCSLAPKHLVRISDSTFQGDMPTQHSCGGSIMLSAAWLEVYRSSITGNPLANRGGAIASTGSAIVLQDTRISNTSAVGYGGSIFQLRGRFWASGSQFTDAYTTREGGGCVYITDATEVRVSGCDFERCVGRAEAGALYYQMMYDKPDVLPPVSIHATRIAHCRAWRDGGALNLVRVNITITDSLFDHNEVG
jgi:predicted outer membrane repeat protein